MTPERNKMRKMEAKERDRERKREQRSKLTVEQLDQLRLKEKVRIQTRRNNMCQTEKEKVKEKDKKRKSLKFWKTRRKARCVKEIKQIDGALRKRLLRSMLSEEDKIKSRKKAKVEMALGRKKGFLRKYKQRTKRDPNRLIIWRDFFKTFDIEFLKSETPKKKHLYNELNVLKKEIRKMEGRERQEYQRAHMFDNMPTWTGRNFKQKGKEATEKFVSKKISKMRTHRKKIKERIENYEELRKISVQSRSNGSDSDSDSDNVSEGGIDVYL